MIDTNSIITISLIVFGGFVILGILSAIISRKGKDPDWKSEVRVHIANASRSVDPKSNHSLKLAIMEYDKLLGLALEKMRLPGNTVGERLKHAKPHFPSPQAYEQAWQLHKLRNKLAHEVSYELPLKTLQASSSSFRQLLESLTR